ncbi:MAG: family 43 glycosylhydrolase [Clostridiales bacterium]|nr:family 43 glycosylhydrolase [Clostridiales bacterium]
MKKGLSCLLACTLALGSAALYCSGGDAESSSAEVPAAQSAVTETGAIPSAEVKTASGTERTIATDTHVSSPSVGSDYQSPLVTLRADPYLYKHTDGTYYFTGSYPEYDRIELTCADSVNGIAAAVPKTVWTLPENERPKNNQFSHYVWAPEIHYVMGQWVIYFARSMGSLWNIKCCALVLNGDDPMHDEWIEAGVIEKTADDNVSFNNMSLDMTVFETGGKWYAIWAQIRPVSNLYIAELETPTKLKTKPLLLSTPEYSWEKVRETVNEGPAVMKHAGKLFVGYSASATGYEYCMGLLEMDASDDPMDLENWTKHSQPVFKTDPSRKIFGPGHNCFVEGDEGEQLCVLHFRDYKDITGDSLLDYNRHAHVMKIKFDRNGAPIFDFDEDELYNTEFKDHNK